MKIGVNIKKIKDLINNSIRPLETSVFYLYNNYLYKDSNLTTKVTVDEFTIASATTVLSILNMDMENFGTYIPLFIKSTVDENGYNVIKVFIMLENGTVKGVYTGPNEQQNGVQ